MIQREVRIVNRLGLHARAAARFVHTASRFRARVTVAGDGRVMDGKSILGILLLAASQGTRLVVSADGEDEAPAVEALAALVEGGFGEDA
ncbi:MAG TPA: HPr family phosphocarrier protein [Vicinamibacteria bacterium]|nr:HPr family phosphocarrier protein [Vicinamibacteria bacterium]